MDPITREFIIQYANLAGKRSDIIDQLIVNRAKVQTAITEAESERATRQAQWNAWYAWYDGLTPEERGGRARRVPVGAAPPR